MTDSIFHIVKCVNKHGVSIPIMVYKVVRGIPDESYGHLKFKTKKFKIRNYVENWEVCMCKIGNRVRQKINFLRTIPL